MDPTKASGSIQYTATDASEGSTVTVGATVYTLTASPAVATDVEIDAGNAARTAQNLVDAINAGNASCEARHDAVARIVYVEAVLAGAAGNALAFSSNEPEFTLTPGGGTLAGGADGTLVSWSLLSLAEARAALRVKGDAADAELVVLLRIVTEMIEDELGYRPVTAASPITEYHDLANPQGFIYLRTRPVVSVTSVLRAGAALATTDYVVSQREGQIALRGSLVAPVSGSGLLKPARTPFVDWPEEQWARGGLYFGQGTDAATVVYVGGYTETSVVPGALKACAEEMLARRYRTRERKSQGVVSEIAQGFSTATKYDPKLMTEDIKARLRPFKTLTTTARR